MLLNELYKPVDRKEIEDALAPFLNYLGSSDQPLQKKHT